MNEIFLNELHGNRKMKCVEFEKIYQNITEPHFNLKYNLIELNKQ